MPLLVAQTMSLQNTNLCDECDERISLDDNYCPNCGTKNEIEWPIQFSYSVSGDGTTSELIEIAGLPHSDEIAEALYHFPGEVVFTATLTEELDVSIDSFQYGTTTYTPEKDE